MSRFNPANLRSLEMNDIDFQQDTIFSDEESLEEFKMKAKKLIKSAFNTPTRRESKSIIHTTKNNNHNGSQKSVKFNEIKIEKQGDSLYVSEMKYPYNDSFNSEDGQTQLYDSKQYFPSQSQQNNNNHHNKKQKKLLITQRDQSLLSSQSQETTRIELSQLSSIQAVDDINHIYPSEFKIHSNEFFENNLSQSSQNLNNSFDAFTYYSENCKNPSESQLIQSKIKRSKSVRSSLCSQEYDIHLNDDPIYVKQKQIDKIWQHSSDNILELKVINKYQCHFETLMKYQKVKWASNYEDRLFPPSKHSLIKRESSYNLDRLYNITWKPLHQVIEVKKNITIGQQINHIDIMTNNWHHTYLVDILSALAEDKSRIQKLLNKNHLEINHKGCFAIRINCKGVWRYILTDDYIPIFRMSQEPVFCQNKFKAYRSIDIWPYLVEKALASYYESYENLEHANIAHTFFDLTGAPYEEINLKEEKITIAAVEKANSLNWITMIRACSDDKKIQNLYPIYRIYAIHQVQTTKRVKQLVVELKYRDDNGYLKYCNYIKENWDIMPTDFQDYALNEAQTNDKIFITYEELINRFDKLIISKIYDDFYYVSTRINQKNINTPTLYKLYLQNQSQFFLQVSQFDQRKMSRGYNYLQCRIILSKYDPEIQKYVYRSGFHQQGRDISQEFNCEGGEYLISIIFETQDQSNLYDATLSYYGDQKTYFEEISYEKNHLLFSEQFSIYAKNIIKRKMKLGSKYLDSNSQMYIPPINSNSFEKMIWFDKTTGIIIEIYNNTQIVTLKLTKNINDYNSKILTLIQNNNQNNSSISQISQSQIQSQQSIPQIQQSSQQDISSNISKQIKSYQVQSNTDYTFVYTINDYPISHISKLKQTLKMYYNTNKDDGKQIN